MEYIRKCELNKLEEEIGYTFKDLQLLDTALTHTSFVKGDGMADKHNERLEFLGDAVLELCVSELLYADPREMNEGSMTRLRAQTVCEAALSKVAGRLQIGTLLQLGKGEDHSGGRNKPSILADAVESIIGAVYIDGGIDDARRFILSFAKESLSYAKRDIEKRDHKTMLQEYVQKYKLGQIKYEIVSSSGPDHMKVFMMQVSVDGKKMGVGTGKTKQEASQNAAGHALSAYGVKID